MVFSRIVAGFVLIGFRINAHLGAIRDQGGMRQSPSLRECSPDQRSDIRGGCR
jgi:hypothetical protein